MMMIVCIIVCNTSNLCNYSLVMMLYSNHSSYILRRLAGGGSPRHVQHVDIFRQNMQATPSGPMEHCSRLLRTSLRAFEPPTGARIGLGRAPESPESHYCIVSCSLHLSVYSLFVVIPRVSLSCVRWA